MIDRLLRDLESRGVELWFEGERLRFRAPKGALTAELRSQLSAARTEVVAHLRAAAEARASSSPLSFSQRALWFLFQRAPLSAAYNVAFTARVVSPLDDRALRQSLQALIDRHASLRTTYALVEGVPTQHVAGAGTAELRVYDVPEIDEAALHQRVVADYRQPFDLEQGPLFRTSVYRRAADDQVLLLVMHHIAVDGWSLLQLVDEMQALYHEAVGGPTASLPRPEIEYTEFVARETQTLAGSDGQRLASYWQRALAEPRAWLELPADRPRELRKAVPGAATLSFDIDANLSSRLRQLARDEGVTLFIVLLAAWKTLLFRCTGTEDVIVGTPTFGRNLPEVARVIGNFVNSIPLRSRLAPDLPFRTLLAQLRQTVLEGLDAQEYPLGLMVERLQSTRDVTRSPLFGTLFVLQRFDQLRALEPVLLPGHAEAITLGALTLRHYALDQQEGQFDLTIQLIDKAGALAGQLKYDSDLYDAATIMRLAGHYQVILGAVAADPGRALAELPLLAPDEREAMIRAAGVPQRAGPAIALHARFEAQVLRAPDAVALACEDERLTYGQLNQRANRLAHRLRAAGVGPETLVGLCTERGIDMVVALLGILKAGGAYLPVDLSYPAERVAFMLADAEAPVLVTERKLSGTLPEHAGTVVFVDDDLSEWPDTNPASGAGPDSLAYVIYTSGSTGRPKGTMITHRAVGRLFDSTEPWYHFGPNDRWTLFHSIAFDFSVWEVWGALLYGGKLVVVPYWVSRSPEAFLELIVRERITVLNQTPSAFRQLIQADIAHGAPRAGALRLVIFGGEALELQSLRAWFDRHGDVQPSLVNMYGITETCVHVTYRPISLRDLEAGAGSVIGVPIPDLRVHVLDARRNPAPYGVIGEMFVGGPGLARGYLKRPDLTESRFVPDPFVPGERLYRTGDLARRLASGELEYLGRSDQQVKIRGFRIELGEIEAALARQPLVRDAAVIAREDAPGDRRLVAYVVAEETAAGLTDELRTALRTILPDYMVPAVFVFLDHLPLTSNGKLDRNSLPRPEATRSATVSYVAPRTRDEELLAKIWTETLGIERVGVHDNFFELGGDSILSLQVIARARQQGLLLTPRQLFEQQTIASLAEVAQHIEGSAGAATLLEPRAGPIPLTPIQRWFVEFAHPEPHHYNQSVLLEVPADYRTDVLRATVRRVVEHHDALRLRFGPPGSWRQVVADTETRDVVEHVDLAHAGPAAQRAAVEAKCNALHASLDLEHGPLLRVAHFTRGAGVPGRLFIVVHHLAVDGVSWRIILGDIEAAYADTMRGKPAALPPVATSFAQWARLLDRHADSAELRGEAAYWTRVAGTPAPRLPAAHAPDRGTFGSTRHVVVALDAGDTRSLLQDVPVAYGTQINDALLTALARALAGVAGGSRVLLELEGHGRVDLFPDVDLSRTVGWFTTLFPVILELPPDGGVGASLQSVKDQLRAIPGSGLGYGVLKFLCRDSALVAPLRSAPVPDVSFNYLGQLDQLAAGSFRFVEEGSGADRVPGGKRSHLLEVNAIVREGRLSVTWSYGDGTLDAGMVEALAGAFLTQLRGLIAHCVSAEAVGYTPSDFALAALDQATLDRLVAAVNADGERTAFPRRSIEDVYPLTPMQQGILFHTLLSPESGVYFQQLSWTLHAPFNPDAFERAWRRLVERHAVLRTSFAWEELDQPLQIVHARVTLPVEHFDWRDVAGVDQRVRFEAFLRADRARGFTLSKPPLLRLTLIRTGDDAYRFVASFHHLSFDGWSLAVLLRELFASYGALLGHKSPPLGPVRPYRDYLAWLAAQESLKAQRYWKDVLRGIRGPTLLGSERQPPGAQGNAVHELKLPPALAAAIQQFAQAQHLTVNTLMLGTWALLLSGRSGENDVLFGTTVAGRPAEIQGVESMVGLFINTLPLRLTIDPGLTLAAWLHGLQAQGAEMRQYEYSSLVHIQGWSDVPQGTPFFQSLLVFENYPVDESLRAGGPLSLSEPRVEEYTNYPMTVFAKPGPHFSVAFSYDTGVFDAAAVQEIGSGFLSLLDGIVADAGGLVGDLALPHASGADGTARRDRDMVAALQYWERELDGAPELLDLPADRPRPAAPSLRRSQVSLDLDTTLIEPLKQLGRTHGVTLFTTLVAAVQVLIHRYSGQDDVLVGTPIRTPAGQFRAGIPGGLAILRGRLGDNPPFAEFLRSTHRTVLRAFGHGAVPFDAIGDAARPYRTSHAPFVQVRFALQPAFAAAATSPDVGTAGFDLGLVVVEQQGRIAVTYQYASELFDDGTIVRMHTHFGQLLRGATTEPALRVQELPMPGSAEDQAILDAVNVTSVEHDRARCVHQLLEAAAFATPDAVAVVAGQSALSYRELDERANRLARLLVRRQVKPKSLVGVCVDRTIEMPVVLAAVLKAGAAYVPLDPTHPAERLRFTLEDAGVACLVTVGRFAPLVAGVEAPLVLLDEVEAELAALPATAPAVAVSAEDRAYVIYTSGSTGRPKGVEVEHRNVVAFLDAMRREPGCGSGDTLLAVTTLAFDIAGLELWLPLSVGARVVVASRADVLDGERLATLIEQHGVTIMQATPATWRLMLDAGWHGKRDLKVLCGGEALPRDLATALVERVGALWNMYGPTETTIWSTASRIDDAAGPITIGHPIANTRVHVLERTGVAAPIGVPGELCIGGEGVARGYHARPELTHEKFASIVLPDGRAERIYRTGDVARFRADGRIAYLGRRDDQVKVRGYRIELGEIEAVLSTHPGVRNCAVIVREDAPGDQRIVGYVVAAERTAFAEESARATLRARLPEYMIPSRFVVLPELPLTPNGKVDRKALPAPAVDASAGDALVAPPDSGTERALAEIWRAVLKAPVTSRYDSFFELGGHSLLATQVVSRIRATFHCDFALRTLFESPVLAALARRIDEVLAAESTDRFPDIARDGPTRGDAGTEIQDLLDTRPDERFEPFPLTDVQEAYWIGRGGGFEIGNVATHVYAEVDIEGLDLDRYERAWQRLIDRHDMLRAIVRPDGQQQVLEHTPPYRIARRDLSDRSPDEAAAALAATRAELSHQVLRSDQWPLFEIRASKLATGRHRIHFSFDMLIGDAWSFSVLQRDFDRLYADPDRELEPLGVSFRDYVLATVRFRETDDFKRSLAYWDARSPSLPPRPDLPLAKDPMSIEDPRFVRHQGTLDRRDWEALQRRAEALGLTYNGLILAAYADVLATWSRHPRFLLNLTLFNRLPVHPQVDDLVGDFTSITLLEVEVLPHETFIEMARRLLARLWEDLDHRFVTGVQVLRRLAREQPDRVVGTAPVVLTSTIGFEGVPTEQSGLASRSDVKFAISQTSQVWLDQMVSTDGGRLQVNWDVVEDLFPPGMIDDMFQSYVDHLTRLARDDAAWHESRVRRVERLVPEAQRRQREAVNATAQPVSDALLHVLFEEQNVVRPEQLAIVGAGARLTYAEVAQLSRRLGATLRAMGARPNTLVAIVMEKGWEQVVAALAILQSGAAYVPIDANLPDERRLTLIENAGASIVLTQPGFADALRWPPAVQVLRVERMGAGTGTAAPLAPVQRSEDLAYVIYTSGSTGIPKGVMIDHRGAVNTIRDMNHRFAVGPDDRVLALSSLSFDLSVYDIFGVLAAGGTIVIPEAAATRDPARWSDLVEQEGVTIWNSVPALMEMFVEYRTGLDAALPPSLRLVLLSGDWIPVTLPGQIRALSRTVQLMSLGGATEASIWSIVYPIDGVDPGWKSIPYGRPMVNQAFHVLDEALEPCPVWVPGQLYIGGIGLAKGYWHDDEKTGAKFIVHPRTAERLYATGDLGRYLPSGDIEFLGREDFQVKIRGFRIELGEIEAAFRQHPAVRSVVVTAVGKSTAERRLLAYVVPQESGADGDGAAATTARAGLESALLEFLASKLPEHMCPARVVLLDQLPLTANGKVDLRALPVPDLGGTGAEPARQAPRNDTEVALLTVWQEVLHTVTIGIHDNFFDLGGDSVSAIQVVSRVVRKGYELSPVMMFRHPTIAELAGKLAAMAPAQREVDEITL